MAKTSTSKPVTDGIAIGLRSLAAMVEDLRDAERVWSEMDDMEAASWSMEWSQLMGLFMPQLERARSADTMKPQQRRRYEQLRAAVQQLRTTIERLELRPPPLP